MLISRDNRARLGESNFLYLFFLRRQESEVIGRRGKKEERMGEEVRKREGGGLRPQKNCELFFSCSSSGLTDRFFSLPLSLLLPSPHGMRRGESNRGRGTKNKREEERGRLKQTFRKGERQENGG